MFSIKKIALATSLSLAAVSAQAGFFEAFVDTLPGGVSPYPDAGFFGNQINGMHDIIEKGATNIILPTYTNHPRWDYDNRNEENAYPFGAGIGRRIIDSHGNERMMYIMTFSDSHYRPEPIFGYAWLARFPIADSGFHLGAGYTASLTFREDYYWLPIPVPLPLVSAGTDAFSVYATFIPVSNVFFFFSRFELDDRNLRLSPLPGDNPWSDNTTTFYAQGSWVKNDLASGDGDFPGGMTLSSDSGFKVGVQQFLDRHWALDLSYQQSDHDLMRHDHKVNDLRLSHIHLLLQYHWEVADSWRLHVGGGASYSQLKADMTGYKDHSVSPTVQTGFTWAMTDNLRLTGDMTVNFAHFKDVDTADGDTLSGRFIPGQASFNLGLGFAF